MLSAKVNMKNCCTAPLHPGEVEGGEAKKSKERYTTNTKHRY